MDDKPSFYRSSDEINPIRIIIGILMGLTVSLLLGYFYNLFSTFIPFIYFNVLITIGLGMTIGMATRIIGKISHLNNKKSRLALVVIMAVSTFLFQWIAYLACFTNEGMIGFGLYLRSIPAALFEGEHLGNLADIYTFGTWSISSFVFNGYLLAMVWLVEFGIMAVLPILSILKTTEFPYSDSQNCWYSKYTLNDQFESMSSKRYFLDEYKQDIPGAIRNLNTGEGWRHGKVHIYYLEEENKGYFSFEKVFFEDRGKGKRTSGFLIENLEISRQDAKSILNGFKNKKVKFEII